MGSFQALRQKPNSYTLPKMNIAHFFIQILLLSCLGPNKRFLDDNTLLKVSFVKYHFYLIFEQFSYTLSKTNITHFFVQISLLSYLWVKWEVFAWYYSFWSKFSKITIFLNFWAFFVHIAQTKLHFFCSNFVIILYWVLNKRFPIYITLFEISFMKYYFSLIFGQFSYTLPETKLAHFFCSNFIII